MVKVTEPLFSDNVRGTIGGVLTFRRGRHGPEAIKPRSETRTHTDGLTPIQQCFAIAKAEHTALDPSTRPSWEDYWNQYLTNNPQCLG